MANSIAPRSFNTNEWIREIRSLKLGNIESGMYLNGKNNLLAFSRTMVADVRWIVRGFVRYSTFEENSRRHLTDLEGNFRRIFLDPAVRNVPQLLVAAVRRATHRTRFARLSGGYMALVPDHSEIGDNVCVLRGSSATIVLRRICSRLLQ